MENQNENNNDKHNNGSRWGMFIAILLLTGVIVFVGSKILSATGSLFSPEMTYDQFMQYLNEDKVEEVCFRNGQEWEVVLKDDMPLQDQLSPR